MFRDPENLHLGLQHQLYRGRRLFSDFSNQEHDFLEWCNNAHTYIITQKDIIGNWEKVYGLNKICQQFLEELRWMLAESGFDNFAHRAEEISSYLHDCNENMNDTIESELFELDDLHQCVYAWSLRAVPLASQMMDWLENLIPAIECAMMNCVYAAPKPSKSHADFFED